MKNKVATWKMLTLWYYIKKIKKLYVHKYVENILNQTTKRNVSKITVIGGKAKI